jgi:rubrerythrin
MKKAPDVPAAPQARAAPRTEYDEAAARLGKAVYRCLACRRQWLADPVPADCPGCGHPYVVWLNYADRKW